MGALVATHFTTADSSSTVTYSQSRLSSLVGGQGQSSTAAMSANPLDQQSSADIAASVAHVTNLPEKYAVANQADSMSTSLAATVESTTTTVAKPQIVVTNFQSNKDIKAYVTKEGDTVTSIAAAYGVTSESIRWSNDLTGDTVTSDITLYIPPINGIVYTVKEGDTPASLATTFTANEDQIIKYNDAELSGLQVGNRVLIPNGKRATVAVRSTAARNTASSSLTPSFISYGYNGYDPGWCTYYAAAKSGAPNGWGNANTWASYARRTPGWTVSSVPVVGAIAQTTSMSYYGHVAIVEAVSEDGSQIKYSDMNGVSGWGRVGYSGWVSVSMYQNYIYR